MKRNRNLSGQEIMEVAITGIIMLLLALGVVVLFGKNIQKVFQSNDSPIIVSAKMNDPNASDPNAGAGPRTNFDQNLVSKHLISKANSDLSIGSSLGQETTGAAGGDSEIGGSYAIQDYSALNDGDPSTTGNLLLDAALAAKSAAMDLFASSESSKSVAEHYIDAAKTLQDKATAQQEVLSNLNDNLVDMQDNMNSVNQSLNTLVKLKAAAQGITSDISTALNSVNTVNNLILSMTSANLSSGQNLLNTNLAQIAAYNNYQSLQSTYDAGWTTCGNIITGTYSCNTSGISTSQISSALAQSNMLLSQVLGMANGVSNSLSVLKPQSDTLKAQATNTKNKAKDLKGQAINTLDVAFGSTKMFKDCTTIDEIIDVATDALKKGKKVDNYSAALSAIDLLKASGAAYKEAEELSAEVTKINNHIDQLNTTMAAYNADAASLSLSADQYNNNHIVALEKDSYAALAAISPAISKTSTALGDLQESSVTLTNQIINQQENVNEVLGQASSAQSMANDAQASAESVLIEAQNSLDSANDTINSIVTFDGK